MKKHLYKVTTLNQQHIYVTAGSISGAESKAKAQKEWSIDDTTNPIMEIQFLTNTVID